MFMLPMISKVIEDDDDDNIKGLFGEARTWKRETSAVRFGMFLRSLENSHLRKKKKGIKFWRIFSVNRHMNH